MDTIKNIFYAISLSINIGFVPGLFFSFNDIGANRYIQNNLFRMAALSLQNNLNRWVLISVVTCLVLLLLFFLVRFLWNFVSATVEIRFKDNKRFRFNKFYKLKKTKIIYIMALSWVVILLLLNVGVFVDSKSGGPGGPNIILVVIDCLRPDHLGCYGYTKGTSPAIDDLAENGILFENAYSCAPWTKPSVASMFTSIYPNEHGAIAMNDVLPDGAVTIAEFLKNKGYYTCFFNGGNFCIGKHFNFDQGFDHYSLHPFKSLKATGLINNFISLVDRIYPKKFFAYIHLMDSHNPYNKNEYNKLFTKKPKTYLQPGVDYISSWHIRIMANDGRLTDEDKRHLISLYDGQIRFIDESIKKMVEFLKARKIFDNTLIVITSDHGEEFWEHNNYEHGHTLYNELLHVPLVVSGNRLKPAKMTKRVSLVDVFPLIVGLSGGKHDLSFLRGVSIEEAIGGEGKADPRLFYSTATLYGDEKYCLIKGDNKIIFNSSNKKNKEQLYGHSSSDEIEIYNLLNDPDEQHNLAGRDRDVLSQMKKELQKFQELNSEFKDVEFVMDNDLKNKLKAIGYVTN